MLVRLIGHEAVSACNARQAMEQLESYDPDVILLDLGLPDASGYDVARAVRARGGKQPFIAAMTGLATTHDRVQSLAAGIDLHVVKPSSEENIRKILTTALAKLTADAGADRS